MTTIHDQITYSSGDLNDPPPESGGRRSRRAWAVPLAAGLVIVLAGSAVAVDGWNNRQDAAHGRAITRWRDARDQLAEHLDLAAVILTDAQAAGLADGALTELHAAIAAASDLDLDIDPALPRSGDITRAREVVTVVDEVRVPLASATAALRDATAVHRAELGLQTLDQATEIIGTALADLDAATAEITDPLAGARERLASSEGKTGSNHEVRFTLTDAIDGAAAELVEADALRGHVTDTTARFDQLRAAFEEIRTSPSTHDSPEEVGPVHVADAGEELTAAHDLATALTARAAALRDHHLASLAAAREAVTAAETAASTTTGTSTGGNGGGGNGTGNGGGTGSGKGGGGNGGGGNGTGNGGGGNGGGAGQVVGNNAPASGGDGSRWVEESTDLCGQLDTQGNAWGWEC